MNHSTQDTATSVAGQNNQTWLQPLVDRVNAIREETIRVKAETAELKRRMTP